MIAEDDGAVITCGFCGEKYEISGEKLRNLIDSADT
jgi:redox-regulated HSP33 family molecular chaperone